MPLKSNCLYILTIASLLACHSPASADDSPIKPSKSQDLTSLQIEDLMKIQVTSATKSAQNLSSVPGAIYVITHEDIRRSGALNIPDLLRAVPGVQVAQITSHKWAITIRGFNGLYANKLLVLIDGRSLYNPSFAGVYWDDQDVNLDDVERVEVIRGPGGAIWGANAVNGVINIITKHSKDTKGVTFSSGAGNEETGFGTLRYGGDAGKDATYRVYAKYFARDASVDSSNNRAFDAWSSVRGGFRLDWDKTRSGKVMLEGDIFHNSAQDAFHVTDLVPPFSHILTENAPSSGLNILGRLEQTPRNGSQATLQAYFQRTFRDEVSIKDSRDTFDVEFQQHLNRGQHSTLTWGLGYRRTSDEFEDTPFISFLPPKKTDNLFSGFLHSETSLKNNLHLTLGTKLEHNDYTGLEVQPNARLSWTPDSRRTLWASVSRAVRTPARNDTGLSIPIAAFPGQGGTINLLTFLGDPNMKSEEVIAHELGYRAELNDRVLLDIAAFYNLYNNSQTTVMGTPSFSNTPSPHLDLPLLFVNGQHGKTYGVEIATRWKATDRWNVSASYSWLQAELSQPTATGRPTNSPSHQVSIVSHLNLAGNLEVDANLFWVNRIRDLNVPDYTRLDLRLGWNPSKSLELSVVGQNLLSLRHKEFGFFDNQGATRFERSVYGKAAWRY